MSFTLKGTADFSDPEDAKFLNLSVSEGPAKGWALSSFPFGTLCSFSF